jgi:predicted ester cyclase
MEKGKETIKIVVAKNDTTESANVDVVKAQVEAWNKHDAAAVDALVGDDGLFRDVTALKDTNKKERSESNKNYWEAFSDARLSISSIWGAGHYVVTVGTFEGTNDGDSPAMNLKKTGKKVSLPFLEIDRLEWGKFKKGWLFFDGGAFAAQLGLMPGE